MSEIDGPRFSLPVGEGVGAMLCLAAGDAAGGANPSGYSATTQQAVVLAYHLLRHRTLSREALAREMAELAGDDKEPTVYRAPSEEFRSWLDSVRAGAPELASDPSIEPAVRVAPVGMWFRRQPEKLVEAALETARLTHLDGPSAVLAAAAAAGVAAACFAQNGRDMLMAVGDLAASAARTIASEGLRFARIDQIDDVLLRLGRSVDLIGEGIDLLGAELGSDPVGLVTVGLTLAAPLTHEPHQVIEEAVRFGGSPLGALVGAIVGARVGVRVWPWAFPNDTWFVALGQKLVAGTRELGDIPDPYAVEHRATGGTGEEETPAGALSD